MSVDLTEVRAHAVRRGSRSIEADSLMVLLSIAESLEALVNLVKPVPAPAPRRELPSPLPWTPKEIQPHPWGSGAELPTTPKRRPEEVLRVICETTDGNPR